MLAKKLKIKQNNKKVDIYRIQTYNSVMCRYFCIGFIDFMLKGKLLLHFTNLVSPSKYEKNDKIIPEFF